MPRISLTLGFSTLALCAFLSPAFATPTLTVTDGAGNTANGTNSGGNLAFSGTVGEWTVSVSTTAPSGGGTSDQLAISYNWNNLFQPSSSPPPNGNKLTITFTVDGLPTVNGPATAVVTGDGAQKNGDVSLSVLTNNVLLTTAGATNLTGFPNAVDFSNAVPVAGFSGVITVKEVIVAGGSELVALGGGVGITNQASQTNVLLKFLPGGILSTNGFKVTLQGMTVGSNYLLQGSTDMVSWLPVTNFQSTNPTMNLTDTNAPKLAHRFYRAKAQ